MNKEYEKKALLVKEIESKQFEISTHYTLKIANDLNMTAEDREVVRRVLNKLDLCPNPSTFDTVENLIHNLNRRKRIANELKPIFDKY